MTVDLSRLDDSLEFEVVKQKIREKIREAERSKNGQGLNTDERLKIARDLIGGFTIAELCEATPEVSLGKTGDKVSFWVSIGEVEAATTTKTGAVVYRVIPNSG